MSENGLIRRICKECGMEIPHEDKALKSVLRENDWICIPCFEVKLGRKI
jgi:hypothetical protein